MSKEYNIYLRFRTFFFVVLALLVLSLIFIPLLGKVYNLIVIVAFLVFSIIGYLLLKKFQSNAFEYVCSKCGETFKLSFSKTLFIKLYKNGVYKECPKCHTKTLLKYHYND